MGAQSSPRSGGHTAVNRARRFLAAAVVSVLVLLVAPPAVDRAAADAATPVEYHRPVDAPILDHFRPPPEPWAAGNRGIDYGTEPGEPVAAAADGRVIFAGQVGGALHVTVEHADGLRTTYSFLDSLTVRAGDRVRAGDVVGIAGGPFHFGVRTPDGEYLDPEAVLAGTARPHIRLVPGTDNGLAALDASERRSLLETLLDDGAAAMGAVSAWSSATSSLAAHYAVELTSPVHVLRAIDAIDQWIEQRGRCTDAAAPVPAHGSRRIVVLVSGLGTASGSNSAWEVDTATLGYADADVVRFSYAGGRAPGPGVEAPTGGATRVRAASGLGSIPVREFTAEDSQQSIPESADRLAALVQSVAASEPGVPIDVVAHSQGGVVARLGIERAGADGDLPDTVDNLVTIASPQQGAPLATDVSALDATAGGSAVLARVRASGVADELDDRRPAIGDLSEVSPVIAELHDRPMPGGVRFVTLGGSGDLVVPGTASGDTAADAGLIMSTPVGTSAHGSLPSDPRTTREIGLAVAGLGPTCQGLGEAMSAFVTAEGIRYGEAVAGFTSAVSAGVLVVPTGS